MHLAEFASGLPRYELCLGEGLMESRGLQILSFLLVAVAQGFAAVDGLSASSEFYFNVLMVSRIGLALAGSVLLLLVAIERRKPLAEGSASLLFLAVALSESFLAYLQADVFGLSYLIVAVSLVLSSAISFVSLGTSLLAMLPSQLTILAAPLLSLPISTWTNQILATQSLILPVTTLVMSFIIWLLNALHLHRRTVTAKLRSMQKRQDILQAQMFLLRKQPRTLQLPPLHETVRERVGDQHAGAKQESISDQVLLDDVIDLLRESISHVQSKFSDRKTMRVTLDLPAPMSLPVAVAAEKTDLRNLFVSAISKSISSLNGEDGVVRIALRVGYKAASVTIEDNGWGLREKFSPNSSIGDELSLREIQAMVSFWGGRLEVLSRLGVGSRMSMELVRVDAFATEAHGDSSEQQADAASHITTGS